MPDRTFPASDFPAPLLRFVELFNRGEFWESHEALEDAWREGRSDFYHGLILYASAFVHVQRRNPRGILAQLDKAERVLQPYPTSYLGVDLRKLLDELEAVRRTVLANGEILEGGWDAEVHFPKIRLDPARVRGDEAESRSG